MSPPARWWEAGERSLEAEEAWFADADLAFALDRELIDAKGIAVFRGELRFHDDRCEATVVYPPAYAAGEQPAVYAPDMPIFRHKRDDGLLCLDHTVFGDVAPMTGVEAVERAEELWRLSIENPDKLSELEADAPDPRADAYHFEPDSGVLLFDVDVAGHSSGVIRLGITYARPFRGALLGLAVDEPQHSELAVGDQNQLFRGDERICGPWQRVIAPPPGPDANSVASWARRHHGTLLDRAVQHAAAHRHVYGTVVPALLGFVFPNEGPRRDEWHDAWLLLLIEPDGALRLVRAAGVSEGDHWLRQPQLVPLENRRVGIVGVGALGSQIAALLARAGVASFFFVDSDVVTPGILVRHQLGFNDVGFSKISAMQQAVARINPVGYPSNSG